MADLVVTIISGAERRDWCDRCLTSAALRFDLYAFAGDSMDGHPVATFGGCTNCDPDLFED